MDRKDEWEISDAPVCVHRKAMRRILPLLNVGTLLRLPLAIAAAVIAAGLIVVTITLVRSCDLDQYNDPGRYRLSTRLGELRSCAVEDGVRVDFKITVLNGGERQFVLYVFAWASHADLHPQRISMWPATAVFRQRPGPNESVVDGYKDGHRLVVPGDGTGFSGQVIIPHDWKGSPAEFRSDGAELTVVFYNVFGYEIARDAYSLRK